uniref:Homing endonuclease LAGLIDADG domain-containing protein n=1 Tax=Morchella brunnea TaxID=1174671 RepID=A0A8K1MHD6_9PEZI|nr:hypothetical protein LK370_mgp034 [Morchella brunnea]UBU98596.1 hypothetical protein [Morchella brunnea]
MSLSNSLLGDPAGGGGPHENFCPRRTPHKHKKKRERTGLVQDLGSSETTREAFILKDNIFKFWLIGFVEGDGSLRPEGWGAWGPLGPQCSPPGLATLTTAHYPGRVRVCVGGGEAAGEFLIYFHPP